MNETLITNAVEQATQFEQQLDFVQALSCYQQAYWLSQKKNQQDQLMFSILFCRQKLAQDTHSMLTVLRAYDQYLLQIEPHFHLRYAIFYNRAVLLRQLGLYQLSLQDIQQSLELQPNFSFAQKIQGELQLLLGDYRLGWKHYQARWHGNQARQDSEIPLWHLEAPPNSRVYIYFEQGIGDCLQFFRYVLVLKQLGFRPCVENHPALHQLLKDNLIQHHIEFTEMPPQADYYASLMDMPYLCQTTLENIPFPQGYLQAPEKMRTKWQPRVNSTGLNIGFCYTSNTQSTNVKLRNIPLPTFAKLFSTAANFHCLQKEITAEDRTLLKQFPNVHLWDHDLADFSDTAGLIAQMDLIISIDTAVAHLAGAMNKKTWLLIAFHPDFRWLLQRNDSPWYNSVRLYRQKDIGDWHYVIQQIQTALSSV